SPTFPSPRLRGEGAEDRRSEAGEGQSRSTLKAPSPGSQLRCSPPSPRFTERVSERVARSHPQFLPPQFEIIAQQSRRAGPGHRAALQDHGAIGQRERKIEMVVDDHQSDLITQAVERLE